MLCTTENAVNKYLSSTVGSLYRAVGFGQLRMYIEHWAQTIQRVCSAQKQESESVCRTEVLEILPVRSWGTTIPAVP